MVCHGAAVCHGEVAHAIPCLKRVLDQRLIEAWEVEDQLAEIDVDSRTGSGIAEAVTEDEIGVLGAETAVDEDGADLSGEVEGAEALDDGLHDGFGEEGVRGAGVEDDGDGEVGGGYGGHFAVVADGDTAQVNGEGVWLLPIGAQGGQDGEGAIVFGRVDATEKDLAGGGCEVVEPKGVGACVNQPLLDH